MSFVTGISVCSRALGVSAVGQTESNKCKFRSRIRPQGGLIPDSRRFEASCEAGDALRGSPISRRTAAFASIAALLAAQTRPVDAAVLEQSRSADGDESEFVKKLREKSEENKEQYQKELRDKWYERGYGESAKFANRDDPVFEAGVASMIIVPGALLAYIAVSNSKSSDEEQK